MEQPAAMVYGGDTELAAADQPMIDDILRGVDRMVLATSVDGNASATPFQIVRDAQDLVFLCCRSSRVAAQLAVNPLVQSVLWPCAADAPHGVEISGYCAEVLDPADRHRLATLFDAAGKVPRRAIDEALAAPPGEFAFFRLRPTRVMLVGTLALPPLGWRDFPDNEPGHPAQALQALSRWMRLWVHAVRAPFFTAALVPVLLGAAVARYAMQRAADLAHWSWPMFFWALAGAVLAAAGTNLINDYGDYRSGADDRNRVGSNPFTGGSRMIQLGLLAPWKVLAASLACYAATVAIGLHINALIAGSAFAPTPLLAIGVLGCALGVAYTVGPFPLSYRGLGEVAVAVGFGPVIVLGASYALTAASVTPWPALASVVASLPVAAFIALVLWINQFEDAPADAASGKRTWVVRVAQSGRASFEFERAFAVYRGLNVLGFVLIAALGALGLAAPRLATPYAWTALLALPLFLLASSRGDRWVRRWREAGAGDRERLPFELLGVNALTIMTHLATGLLLAAAYLVGSLS